MSPPPKFPPFDPATLLRPETELECLLLQQPEFVEGLFWGEPRFGHPEGNVVYHIEEILGNIEKLQPRFGEYREKLRLLAYVHDTFKFREDKSVPRDWSKHHGRLARLFLERFYDDREVLEIVERHDEAYYCWRIFERQQMYVEGLQSLDRLLEKVAECRQLYYLFFWCDTSTGDKTLAPLRWFERTVGGIEVV